MHYHQLTLDERYQIQALLHIGKSKDEVARTLGRHRSTIYREIKRHTWRNGYRAKPAQRVADYTRVLLRYKYKLNPSVIYGIRWGLHQGWSPEQICGRLMSEFKLKLSAETIYRHVAEDKANGGELYKLLRRWRRRKRRFPRELRQNVGIPGRKPISERPKCVEQRARTGDWERDLMHGENRKKAVLALLERRSRYVLLRKLANKTAAVTAAATCRALKGKPLHTLTNDNGREFARHQAESQKLNVPIYFTNPYTASERGSCENVIGLVRQYLPKRFDIDALSHQELRRVEKLINDRPRKCLNYKTPREVFTRKSVKLFPPVVALLC